MGNIRVLVQIWWGLKGRPPISVDEGLALVQSSDDVERDIESALAAGIFRGEGNVRCVLVGKRPRINPQLNASVEMCDKESVAKVARVWGADYCVAEGDAQAARTLGEPA